MDGTIQAGTPEDAGNTSESHPVSSRGPSRPSLEKLIQVAKGGFEIQACHGLPWVFKFNKFTINY
jgi:hypothetical protein